jgi:hypothetical protein
MVRREEEMAMQDAGEVAVTVDSSTLCYDDHETNRAKGRYEPEETPAWQRLLPLPSDAGEGRAP